MNIKHPKALEKRTQDILSGVVKVGAAKKAAEAKLQNVGANLRKETIAGVGRVKAAVADVKKSGVHPLKTDHIRRVKVNFEDGSSKVMSAEDAKKWPKNR